MHRRKSFLFRLFALLFALLLLITASVELALYHYARQVVGQEYIRLNQAGLRQISYTLGQGMTDTQTLAKRIAESTQLIELLSGPAGERADEAAHDLLYSLSSDYVWQRGIKMLMDSYVVGFNGVTAATYSSRQFNYDAVLADPRYGPLFSGTQDALLLPTTTHPEATGIFVHSFQYAQLIRDHLTQEPLGVVILNISEVSLYSQYLRHQSADNRFFLTDGSGTIVSARDKQLIGSIYAYTPEELDALAAETSLSRRIDGGQIRLYERIPGTDWYLVEEMSASAAFGTLNLVRNGAFLATGLCAALILAVLLYAYRQILRPITQLQASLGRVMEGRLDERIDVRIRPYSGGLQRYGGADLHPSGVGQTGGAGEASGGAGFSPGPDQPPLHLQYPQLHPLPAGDGQGTGGGGDGVLLLQAAAPDSLPLGGVHPPGGGAGHAEVLCGAPAPALSRYL